jgi:hypothetical protein
VTDYRSIQAVTEPHDTGQLDDAGRCQCAFTVLAWKTPSATFVEELIKVLVDAGVGVFSETIFGGSASVIPEGDGPFLHVKTDGGAGAVGTHSDSPAGWDRRPSAVVTVHAKKWTAAEAMAQLGYSAFVNVRNMAVVA